MEITWRDRLEWILLVGPLKTQENSNWNRYVNIYFLSNLVARNIFKLSDLTDFERTFEEYFLLKN
jgi:hypothetical protein